MSIKQEYVIFGILGCILLWVLYFSATVDRRIDDNKKELNALEDSVRRVYQSRKTDSLRISELQLTIDSIKTAKSIITRKASHERTVIRNASADSLAHIVRSGLIEVQP